jgi:hypothetical protein
MKKYLFLTLVGIIVILGFYISLTHSCTRKIKQDNKDLKQIINNPGIQAERSIDKEGKEHYKKPVEEIANPTNLQQDPELKKILSSIDARVKNIEMVSSTATHSHTAYYTRFKDSTIHDTVKTKCFTLQDPWTKITGCDGDSTYIDSYDTSNIVVYKERVQWPKIKLGSKVTIKGPRIGKQVITSDLSNRNPHNKIVVNKTVVVKKRK